MRRTDYLKDLAQAVGEDLLEVRDLRDGWPALCRVKVGSGWTPVAIHVGFIGSGGRGRDSVERRFQNPGKNPMSAPAGYRPVLVGVQYGTDGKIIAVAGMDAGSRMDRETRHSHFVAASALDEVATSGWVDWTSGSGESIAVFRPELLPVFVAKDQANVAVPGLPEVVQASGLLEESGPEAGERARRAAMHALRDARFSKAVLAAYEGMCAMCGLGHGLVDGAHIYPVRAPGSEDSVWNGIALCANHHRAFDAHRVHVAPDSWVISLHPTLRGGAASNAACRSFVATTRRKLLPPHYPSHAPRPEMFVKRYGFFGGAYSWASS